jgi:hypothetical protein
MVLFVFKNWKFASRCRIASGLYGPLEQELCMDDRIYNMQQYEWKLQHFKLTRYVNFSNVYELGMDSF